MILVSACLLGEACRYDGKSRPDAGLMAQMREGTVIPVCPERLGGLPTPRPSAEIVGGAGADVLVGRARAVNKHGVDVTDAFLGGAQETLRLCRMAGAQRAILKQNSPSCGCGAIYDGSFTGTLRAGDGITAALLRQNGIEIEPR